MICQCGCNIEIVNKPYHRYVDVKFIAGHNSRIKHSGWFKKKPESTNSNTGHWRINSNIKAKNYLCELRFTGQCKGTLEIHHKDGNPCNNIKLNLSFLCKSHHKLIHNKTISYEKPIAYFYEDKSGKRRYKKGEEL